MKTTARLIVLGSAVSLGGCGASVVNMLDSSATPQTTTVQSHIVTGPMDSNGNVTSVTDRTSNGVETSVTLNVASLPGGGQFPTSAEVAFNGKTDGGMTIPGSGRMKVDGALAERAMNGEDIDESSVRYAAEGDAFLQILDAGNGYATARYQGKSGTTGILGYVVAGQRTEASSMPTGGSATFTGSAHGTSFGSSTGAQGMTGKTEIKAAFAPGGGTVSGKITDVNVGGTNTGYEITMNPVGISGSGYSGGTMSVSGASMSSSNYQGGFYNPEANGTAGTFHFRASGVATGTGGTQDVEMVGAFGANR